MALQLEWANGGTGVVVETDGARVVVRSSRAAAPGTPLVANVLLNSCSQVRVKVQDCRRQQDGEFSIRGRWLDLSRAMRDEILASAK